MGEREGGVNWSLVGTWMIIYNILFLVIDEFLYYSYGLKFLGFGGTKAFFEFHIPLFLMVSFVLGLFSYKMHPKDMFYASFISPLVFYFLDMAVTVYQYLYVDPGILSTLYINVGQDPLLKYVFVGGLGSLMWVIVVVPFLAGAFLAGHTISYIYSRRRAEHKIMSMIYSSRDRETEEEY